jgi:hypothetical protein
MRTEATTGGTERRVVFTGGMQAPPLRRVNREGPSPGKQSGPSIGTRDLGVSGNTAFL